MPRTNNQAYFGSATDIPGSGTEDKESDEKLSAVYPDLAHPSLIPTLVQSAKTPKTPENNKIVKVDLENFF